MNIHEATNNPKRHRTKFPPVEIRIYCKKCGNIHVNIEDCPHLDFEMIKREMRRRAEAEQWARNKAAHWLNELTLAHGKISMLKHEIAELRSKLKS